MKLTADKKQVTSRSYYYLLDFNDHDNWETISSMFGVMKLSQLTLKEYQQLFKQVTSREFE